MKNIYNPTHSHSLQVEESHVVKFNPCKLLFLPLFLLLNSLLTTAIAQEQLLGGGPASSHSSAVLADGKAFSWGYNVQGQVGDGTLINRNYPVNISDLGVLIDKSVISIANGYTHSLAVADDGDVYAWGGITEGQLGFVSATRVLLPQRVSLPLPIGVKATAVAAGYALSLARTDDGSIYAWGWGGKGQLGNNETKSYTLPQKVRLPAGVTARAVYAGEQHSMALADDGSIYAWGWGGWGQLGNDDIRSYALPQKVRLPEGVTARAVSTGLYHTLAVGSDNNLYVWGDGAFGQLGLGPSITRAVSPQKVTLAEGVTAVAVAAGGYHSVAVGSDGNIYAWGQGKLGQIGNNTYSSYNTPQKVSLPVGVTANKVAAGFYHSLSVCSDGKVYAWGYGDNGQLGEGPRNTSRIPVPVMLPSCTPPSPTFTSMPDESSCLGTDIIYTTQSGQLNYEWNFPGAAGIDYSITSGGSIASSSTIVKWLTVGSKTVTVNYKNIGGCSGPSAATSTTLVSTPTDAAIFGPNTAVISTTTNYSLTGTAVEILSWKATSSTTAGEALYASVTGSGSFDILWPGTPTVFKLSVTYTNGACVRTATTYISVYDPSSGFVTGGGAVNSPAGALVATPDAVGEAQFGLVARFDKTGKVTGNTDFEFLAGGFSFKSISHSDGSLVIDNARATYRGEGYLRDPVTGAKLNDVVYKFMVSAYDPQVTGSTEKDRFRIKITNKVSGDVAYDNLVSYDDNIDLSSTSFVSTELQSGSIVIHKPLTVKGGSTASKLVTVAKSDPELSLIKFHNYPNPYSGRTMFTFSIYKEESFALEVYDMKGALIKKVVNGKAEPGKVYEFEFDSRNIAEGIYLARLVTSSEIQSHKMIIKK